MQMNNANWFVPAEQNQVFVSVYAYRAPEGEEDTTFTLTMNIGGQTPDTHILNEDAQRFRNVRMRVDWGAGPMPPFKTTGTSQNPSTTLPAPTHTITSSSWMMLVRLLKWSGSVLKA